jgi:hypothetical protein
VHFSHKDVLVNKLVPLKIFLFMWHLPNNRFPTKDNLIWRGILNEDSALCSDACSKAEALWLSTFVLWLWFLLVCLIWCGKLTKFQYCPSSWSLCTCSSIWRSFIYRLWSLVHLEEHNNRIFNVKSLSKD